MLNFNSMHTSDINKYKAEIQLMVEEHEAELDRMFKILDAAQRADFIIQTIDDHTKASYRERLESLTKSQTIDDNMMSSYEEKVGSLRRMM